MPLENMASGIPEYLENTVKSCIIAGMTPRQVVVVVICALCETSELFEDNDAFRRALWGLNEVVDEAEGIERVRNK